MRRGQGNRRRAAALALAVVVWAGGTLVAAPETPAPAPQTAPARKAAIADLAWFEGRWQGQSAEGSVEEIWSGPDGGSLMGMYRVIEGGRTVFFELLAIEHGESGALTGDRSGVERRDGRGTGGRRLP